MNFRAWIFCACYIWTVPVSAGLFSLFQPDPPVPVPYVTEAEAVLDLKSTLKHVSQCQWASCKYPAQKGVPSSDPYPSCKAWNAEWDLFIKRYRMSGPVVQTPLVSWYWSKILETDRAICD